MQVTIKDIEVDDYDIGVLEHLVLHYLDQNNEADEIPIFVLKELILKYNRAGVKKVIECSN